MNTVSDRCAFIIRGTLELLRLLTQHAVQSTEHSVGHENSKRNDERDNKDPFALLHVLVDDFLCRALGSVGFTAWTLCG